METDVTDIVAKQGWTLKKPFVAKMTKTMVDNLLPPVVIRKKIDKGGYMINVIDNRTLSPSAPFSVSLSLPKTLTVARSDLVPKPFQLEKSVSVFANGKGGKMINGKVTLSPGEERRHYGNLLQKYSG